jgi:cytidine deaminase
MRPKFNAFRSASTELLKRVEANDRLTGVYSDVFVEKSKKNKDQDNETKVVTGFAVSNNTPMGQWGDFHVADDGREIDISEPPEPIAIHFPLIAALIPTWIDIVAEKHSSVGNRVLYLLSGTATPRVETTNSTNGKKKNDDENSTFSTAKLIQHFINRFYPHVTVCHVHSGSGIFRFDHNVEFINRCLKPTIRVHCCKLAEALEDDWVDFFHMFISLTDGSPARIAALNAGLREFRPDYLHVLQPKSFFYSNRVNSRNICYEPFEKIDVRPAMSRDQLTDKIQTLVSKMITFRDKFEHSSESSESTELGSFWLRKTKKPVLAVLLVQKANETKPRFFYGINMEVSMPTGSLCAERNCIGTALSSDFTLRRRDIQMVAVLSVPKRRDDGCSVMASSPGKKVPSLVPSSNNQTAECAVRPLSASVSPRKRIKRRRLGSSFDKFLQNHQEHDHHDHRKNGDCDDTSLNPISPCGACMEWLRKISEVNPKFRVITFSDITCEKVFVRCVPIG